LDGSIQLSTSDRKTLIAAFQRGPTLQGSRRAQVILLPAAGWSWREIRAIVFVSFDLIRECLARWRRGGAIAVMKAATKTATISAWLEQVAQWLTLKTPRDFGYFRTRWSFADSWVRQSRI
jgi:transposase